jgi:hypothetical protein
MGKLLIAPAVVIYAIGGLWGRFVALNIVHQVGGTILTIIAFFAAPIVLYLAPWYALIAKGDWFPLALIYGTTVLAGILFSIGQAIDDPR